MAAPSYTLPTVGSPNSTEDPLIRTALSDLKTLLTDALDDSNISTGGVGSGSIAANAVTTAKILDANVTAAKLSTDVANANISTTAAIAGSKLDTGDGRLVQTTGLIQCSGAITCTTTFADVTGATVTFTPDVACYALVVASFTFFISAASGVEGAVGHGTLVVDGSAQTPSVTGGFTNVGGSATIDSQFTSSMTYRVPLTAASHTLKLQAKKTETGTTTVATVNPGVQFLYQLVAQ